jgi:hypothetical protein
MWPDGTSMWLDCQMIMIMIVMVHSPLKPQLVLIIFKHSVRAPMKTQLITITKNNQLIPVKEIIAAYSENLMKPTNTLSEKTAGLLIVKAA